MDNAANLLFGDKSVMTATGTFPYQQVDVWMSMFEVGNEHRRLRLALNLGFTAAAVRNYLPVFRKAAETVRVFGPQIS
jgi:cytochrome P450